MLAARSMPQKYNYIPIQLIPNDATVNKAALLKTEYAKVAKQLTRYFVVGRAAETLNRSSSLDLWQDICPNGGQITFELIVQLPFYLPSLKKKDEYWLQVDGITYVVNNRQVEVVTNDAPNKYFFCHVGLLETLRQQYSGEIVQTIHLPSLVSTKRRISCLSVSDAIETNMHKWIQELNRDVSKLVGGLRHLCTDPASIPEFHGIENTCSMYIVAKSGKKLGLIPFISKIYASQIRSFTQIKMKVEDVEKCINQDHSIPHHYFLDAAQSAMRMGQISSALIFACTACESAINHLVKDELARQELGKDRIKSALNDLRFSQQLHLISRLIPRLKKHSDKLAPIDKMRKRRNDLVHRGATVGQEDLATTQRGIEAIKEMINGIRVLRNRR